MDVLLPRLSSGEPANLAPLLEGIVGRGPGTGGRADQFDDWLADPVYHEDIRVARGSLLADLEAAWRQGVLSTEAAMEVEVPRSGGRRMRAASLPIGLRLVAHAVIADSAPRLSRSILRDKVLGFGFRPTGMPRFEAPGERAELLGEAATELIELGYGDDVIVLDVSGFLLNASNEGMTAALRRARVLDEPIRFLGDLLSDDAAGLPSIDDAFAFLYNLLLAPVDAEIAGREINFFRYRDEYFLFDERDVAPVERALERLGLSARTITRRLHPHDRHTDLQILADRMTRDELEEAGTLEDVIGRIGDVYLFTEYDPLCSSDCFEVSFGVAPALTKKWFFASCRNGRIVDGVEALPCLRSFHRNRLPAAWRPAPVSDGPDSLMATVGELTANRDALVEALRTGLEQLVDWQIGWAARFLSDAGMATPDETGLLRRAVAESGRVGAEAARIALARSSAVAASEFWEPIRPDDPAYVRRSRGLAAHLLARRGEPGPMVQAKDVLAGTDPTLLIYLARI